MHELDIDVSGEGRRDGDRHDRRRYQRRDAPRRQDCAGDQGRQYVQHEARGRQVSVTGRDVDACSKGTEADQCA